MCARLARVFAVVLTSAVAQVVLAASGWAEEPFSFTHVAVRQGDAAVYEGPCVGSWG